MEPINRPKAWRMSVHVDEDGIRALVEWQGWRDRRWHATHGYTGQLWSEGGAAAVLAAMMATLRASTGAESEYDHQDDYEPPWVQG